MALDDVIRAHKNYQKISAIAQAIDEKPSDPDLHMNLLAHYTNTYSITENDARVMLDFTPGKDYAKPEAMQFYVGQAHGTDRNTLKTAVKGKLEEIIDNADEKKLLEFAAIMPEKTKEHILMQEAMAKKDYGSMVNLLLKKYDNPIWQDYIKGLHNALAIPAYGEIVGKQLLGIANNYVQDKKTEFINKNLSDKVEYEKDGKKKVKYVPNAGKIRNYVKKTFTTYKDTDPIKDELYLHLAGTIK